MTWAIGRRGSGAVRRARGRARTGNGFTLAEVLAAAAILGVLLLTAWPSLRTLAGRARARTAAHTLFERLQAGRERALYSGSPVQIDLPTDREVRASSAAALFRPDGTARALRIEIGSAASGIFEVVVRETGRIAVHEAKR